ncbi:MAG: ferritin [Desulfuromonas sp.]|uniref:ferritin-like domain-containing protein n=1 Tax=Desulfuromonas sp. TaxID=892 RepID=UPI000CC8B330|nr:ferritin family protein [Desulfuromonas sp.]PLX84835.1 MAG: ferritin [Desulfuromonas sp.]
MPQEFKLQEALKLAIETEKNVMDFYKRAAEITRDERGKKVFTQLAKEEQEHAGHFFPLYQGADLGSFEDFMATAPQLDSAMLVELEKSLDENVQERKAMEIALREEEELEKNLRLTASKIADTAVRAVFEKMAEETRQHYQIIESEYARLMGMVHETDIDTYVRE